MAKSANSSASLKDLESQLELYFGKKAPPIPANLKELIVKFAPWITLILMILLAPVILAALGLSAVLLPVSVFAGSSSGLMGMISLIGSIAVLVLELVALPGLFKRQLQGWRFLYYSVLVNAVVSLVSFNIIGGIIGTLLGLYILFQIKSYYH
jgi:hypothetical protein